MQGSRHTAEFKAEAIKQITKRGHGVVEVSKRLGVCNNLNICHTFILTAMIG